MQKINIQWGMILLTLLSNTFIFHAQDNAYFDKVIQPSPTSLVYQRYGDHQPLLSSGIVQIPIPLFEIKEDNFTLPITMQYSTSGINVMDVPYPMGYGWVFLPGLRITRTVLGRPDDVYPFYKIDPYAPLSGQALKKAIVEPGQLAQCHSLSDKDLIDTQKDLFTIHLPTGSVNFYINRVGNGYEAVTYGNALKIELVTTLNSYMYIKGIRVYDEQGVVYYFGHFADETVVKNYTEFVNNPFYDTAWFLREIKLPNQSVINFTWKPVNINKYFSFAVEQPSTTIVDRLTSTACINSQFEIQEGSRWQWISKYEKVLALEKIEFPSGSLAINYKSAEEPFITKMELKNKSGVTCKTVDLTYKAGDALENTLLEKLKINAEEYRFSYNSNRFYKNTKSLDYWGYYNGKNNNSLLPSMRLKIYLPKSVNALYQNIGSADRSVADDKMQAFMLTKITYPTGGYSEFEYEPHRFTDRYSNSAPDLFYQASEPALNKGGGLRVSKISTRADAASPVTVKTYKYGKNENGLVNITYVPTLDSFIDEYTTYIDACYQPFTNPVVQFCRVLQINPLSSYSKYLFQGVSLWYDKVTEYVNNDHKTEYYFDYECDLTPGRLCLSIDVYRPYVRKNWVLFQDKPRQTKIIQYVKKGQNYSPQNETSMLYERMSYNSSIQKGNIITRKSINTGSLFSRCPELGDLDFTSGLGIGGSPSLVDYEGDGYGVWEYEIQPIFYRLKTKETKLFTETNDSIVTTEDYEYSTYNHVKKVTLSTSNASKKGVQEYKFPYDYTQSIYQTMKSKNMLTPVVEEIRSFGGSEIYRERTSYDNSQSITAGLIRKVSTETSYSGSNSYRTEVAYNRYDTHGNLLQATLLDGTKITYLWSYNYQYPIAEIKGAAYSDVTGKISESSLNTIAAKSEPATADWTTINNLRTQLPNALVTTYTYKPLVGIQTMTDPRGVVTKYDYDSFGRLIKVTQADRVIESYEYHYKN